MSTEAIDKENSRRQKLLFPYDIEDVAPKINSKLIADFEGQKSGFVQVGSKKWLMPTPYAKDAANLFNFELEPDDVIVGTFPRSGTTLISEMAWLLCNDLEYQKAADIPLTERFRFLEASCLFSDPLIKELLKENENKPEQIQIVENILYPAWERLDKTNGRRFIKTHLPFDLLPQNIIDLGCKVIYVARNPKDVAVFYYHLNKVWKLFSYSGNFANFWNYFRDDLVISAPYWEHIKQGWSIRHKKNVLFLFFEDIIKDLGSNIDKMASFLNKSYSSDQLETLEKHLQFENFRKNKSIIPEGASVIAHKSEDNFIRKGKSGSWRDYFDEKMTKDADMWIEENLKNIDLKFPEV